VDSSFQLVQAPLGFRLMPYDQVVVRDIPMFESQRTIQISGQVLYPGQYALETDRVYLSQLIADAGGLTGIADDRNATLFREYNNLGPLGINLRLALRHRQNPRFDPLVLEGDVVTIPKLQSSVGMRIRATRLEGLVEQADLQPKAITHFSYQGQKSAKWYIKRNAGGFARKEDRRSVTVAMANGQVMGTHTKLGLFKVYPTVYPGSVVSVDYKPEKPVSDRRFDWDRFANATIQTATSAVTLLLLISRF